MRSVARALAALLVLGSAASYGLGAVASAAPVAAPKGGCWSYVPSAAALTAPPASDLSTVRAGWTTVADGGFELTSGGATVVGGTRTATVRIANGPVISTNAVTGTASVLLSVDGTPQAPLEVDFSTAAGAPVEDLEAEATDLPVGAAGDHTIRLDAVYFDVPAADLRVACNGQAGGTPGGPNPATNPEPTDLTTGFTAVASSSVTITSVDDQAVLNAARPGDVVTTEVTGLASSVPAIIELCPTAGECTPVGDVLTEPDGTATASPMIPGSAPVGAGTLRISDGTTEVSAELAVLGVQVVAAAEALDTDSTIVTLTGSGWDPQRQVTIRGYAGTDSSTPVTSDAEVVAQVDAAGQFAAEYAVSDEATESVIVDQARTSTNIGAVYLISGVIGGAVDDVTTDPPQEADPASEAATATPPASTTPPATVLPPGSVTTPPADIPLPEDIPVVKPPAETPTGTPGVEDLSVSEERLDGQMTMSELFGGSPERDLVFLVENVGTETVENPVVRVSVGRSEDVEPEIVDAEVGVLDPGEQTVVTVPLELPMAAFGTYRVVGQVGETEVGAFEVEWTTYPWGLFALNVLALALLAWGIRTRLAQRRPAGAAALPGDADAVVDLAAADNWWTHGTAVVGPIPGEPSSGEAIVDLDAAEQWWQRSAGNSSSRVS